MKPWTFYRGPIWVAPCKGERCKARTTVGGRRIRCFLPRYRHGKVHSGVIGERRWRK